MVRAKRGRMKRRARIDATLKRISLANYVSNSLTRHFQNLRMVLWKNIDKKSCCYQRERGAEGLVLRCIQSMLKHHLSVSCRNYSNTFASASTPSTLPLKHLSGPQIILLWNSEETRLWSWTNLMKPSRWHWFFAKAFLTEAAFHCWVLRDSWFRS